MNNPYITLNKSKQKISAEKILQTPLSNWTRVPGPPSGTNLENLENGKDISNG